MPSDVLEVVGWDIGGVHIKAVRALWRNGEIVDMQAVVRPFEIWRKPENLPKFQAYIQDVIRAHARDERVLWWEIFNEPDMKSEYSIDLRRRGYGWAKEVGPVQPVLSCWDDNPETDIVDAHNYSANFDSWDGEMRIA